ncbi:Smr/MutS family protein [Sphingomonas morindae]|uniref:Smr/MutS family protein n=1 Tax=Sphingomonas morindae TaxID=1541170 RepID=A0ABY4XAG2_9SPHN|nr:Smr/MutS family protein [Sphingomonas morindae]USI73951.1 Smr/MutS family protein [Sphingomonas morindae]
MRDRPLAPDEAALWRRVAATVRPLKGRAGVSAPAAKAEPAATAPDAAAPTSPPAVPAPPALARARPAPAPPRLSNTLDGGWDRRLARGAAAPDYVIDLHGHGLAAAHAALDAGLARATAAGARLVLLVTGRPPPPGRSRMDDPLRGVIRASVTDWLHHSRHAAAIAAIRAAHPRHGGAGALYLVLRRARV